MSNANPTLTLRIQADANGAISIISQTAGAVNELGQRSTQASGDLGRLGSNIRNTGDNANRASRETQNYNQELRNTQQAATTASGALNALKSIMGGLSVAFTAKQILSEISSFETKLLSLKALTMANTEQMKQMETQARSLGATTAFSAQQAAEAQGVLASAGLKTNEILKATPQILQLAAAGTLDLAKAAEISIAVMHGMGLELKDLGHINDVLVQAANDYTINVEMLGHAFGETAVVAHTYGVSLEATASSLGILKESGMAAGSIGDALKTLFGALVNDTKENIAVLGNYTTGLDKHKMTYKDLNVETLGYTKVLQNLKDAHIGATDMTKLFGETASTAAIGLSEHVNKIKENEASYIKLNGVAERQSEILNQGLSKAWDALLGTLGEAAQQFGEAGTKIDETGKSTGGLKVGLTDLIKEATGVILIYEGMGDEFARSNKLTAEQYGHLKDVAGALRSFGGAVEGVVLLTGAIYGLRTAQLAFNAAAAMNPYIAGATVLAGTIGYVHSKINEGQEKQAELVKKSTTAEEANLKVKQQIAKVAGIQAQDKLTIDKNYLEREKATLTFLVDQRNLLEKKPVAIPDGVDGDFIKATANHSKSLDADADSAGKSAAAHKALTDAQRAAKKEQQDYQHLIESTPYGEYNATIDKLTAGLKRGGEAFRATYATGIEEANKKLLDSTQYVKDHTEALKEQQHAFDQTARGKFEKSTDELRAQKPFMSQAEYANKQDKIGVDYLHETGQNKEAKTQIDLATEAQKAFKDELAKTTAVFDDVSNSGKMAFDGILGGISSVASAFSEFGKSIESIDKKWADYGANYSKLMQIEGATQAEKTALTEKYYKDKQAYESASFQAEISGARSIAGATAKMFSEKSAGRKAFHAVEMTLSVIEMAMSIKKIGTNVIEAITNQGKGDPYSAFPRIAAMTAIMAVVAGGVAAIAGGGGGGASFSGTYSQMTPTKSTGTVLGDSSANSTSIKNVTDVLNEIHAKEYPELKGINDTLKEFGKIIVSVITNIAKTTGSFTDMSFGVTQLEQPKNTLSSIPFIGGLFTKTTVTKIGEGMIIEAFNPLVEGMELGLKSYSTFEIKKKSLFGTKTTIQEIYGDVPDAISNEMTKLFSYMGKGVMQSLTSMDIVKYLGVSLPNFSIGTQKWDWFKADNKQEYFNNMINATADRIAAVSQHVIGVFQKLGEGLFETVNRLAIEQGVVMNKYKKFGIDFGVLTTKLDDGSRIGSLGLTAVSDSLITMYNSSADAKDGLKNFIAAMDDFYNTVMTKGQKAQYTVSTATDYLTKQGLDANKLYDEKYVREQLLLKQKELAALEEQKGAAYEKVAALGDYVGNAFTPQSGEDLTGLSSSVFRKILGTSDFSSATWEKVGGGWTESMIRAMAGVNDLWDSLIASLDKNRMLQAGGEAGLAAAGVSYSSKAEYEAQRQGLQDEIDKVSAQIGELYDTTDAFNTILNKTIPSFKKVQDDYLAAIESDFKTTSRKRADYIRDELDGITTDLSAESYLKPIIDAMHAAGIQGKITASMIQEFTWSAQDAAKALKKLADATKYQSNLSQSLQDWVMGLKITSIGSTKSQLDAAAQNFEAKLRVINGGLTTSAEQKQAALNGITGNADQYIQAIHNFYGSNKEGVDLINQLVDKVSSLPEQVDVAQLQLGVLQQIRDGVFTFPEAITDAQKLLIQPLLDNVAQAQKTYLAAPTWQNDLMANTLAKELTMAVSYAQKGGGFLEAFIRSFDGSQGLTQAVNLILSDKSLNATQAQTAIDNVLQIVEAFVDLKINVSDKLAGWAQDEINHQIELVNPNQIYLKADSKNVTNTITSLVSNDKLIGFNDKDYIAKIDLTGVEPVIDSLNKVTVAANDAYAAMNRVATQPAANDASVYTQGNSFLESQATNLGYSGDYTDIAAMQKFIDSVTNSPAIQSPAIPYPIALTPNDITSIKPEIKDLGSANGLSTLTAYKDPAIIQLIDSATKIAETQPTTRSGYASQANAQNVLDNYKTWYPTYFAKGGAFTNGVVDEPTVFNMGIMGEAGTEMIMPATRMPDGSLGVRAIGNPSNDSNTDSSKEIAELKQEVSELKGILAELVRATKEGNDIVLNGFTLTLAENEKQSKSLKTAEKENLRQVYK